MEPCKDCVEFLENAPVGEVLTCVFTVVSGLIIRAIEKRKMKRKNRGF